MKGIIPFIELLLPLLWTSSDACQGFEATMNPLICVLYHLHTMYSLDSSWPAWRAVPHESTFSGIDKMCNVPPTDALNRLS